MKTLLPLLMLLLSATLGSALIPRALSIVTTHAAFIDHQSNSLVAERRYEFGRPHMGTMVKIVVYGRDEGAAAEAVARAFNRVAELDARLSDYRQDSELTLLCSRDAGSWISVSEDLFRVLTAAQEMAERTAGIFDVTAGPLVRLWRRARRSGELPAALEIENARMLTGYKKLMLDETRRRVMLTAPGMLLDLGGIAKGFAADEAMTMLKQQGVTRALVAAGGDIVVSEAPPGTDGWTIAVAGLEGAHAAPVAHLRLRERAVSTSGDTEQFVEINGTRHSHVIDPRTGMAVAGRRSVTIVAPRGTFADSLATAANVLGGHRALTLIESVPDAAGLILQNTANGLVSLESKRWRALADQPAECGVGGVQRNDS